MLILASTSQSRRDLLTNAGLDFEIRAPGVDEDEVKLSLVARKADATAIATALAELKATRVSARHPEAFTIGGDSTLACDGRLFDKPPSIAAARDRFYKGDIARGIVAFHKEAGGFLREQDLESARIAWSKRFKTPPMRGAPIGRGAASQRQRPGSLYWQRPAKCLD